MDYNIHQAIPMEVVGFGERCCGTICRHLENVLDGDDYCLFDIKESLSSGPVWFS